MNLPLLQVKEIQKTYVNQNGWLRREIIQALKPSSFELEQGKTLAVVGETGSGKSTLAHLLAGGKMPDQGEILWRGQNIYDLPPNQRAKVIRLIPQKPSQSLNPRVRVGDQIIAPLLHYGMCDEIKAGRKMLKTLRDVGLLEERADYYPNMLSNSQRLKVALARALIVDPEILVFDQTLTSVEITMRAQLLNLLNKLKRSRGMSYVVIGHQISMLRHLADDVLVMQEGQILEKISASQLFTFDTPKHAYTTRLMEAYKELTQGGAI